MPRLRRSLPLPHLRRSLPLPPLRHFLSLYFSADSSSSSPQGSSMASASSVVAPPTPSASSWGRDTSRRGPSRGVTERRLGDGQQWNVSLVRGYGVGPTIDIFYELYACCIKTVL
ncbi:hypothetical protein Taro_054342 [Colocasia esculenta]|uniref:Uncharacterized protein n=1 Tax=Colocasia esculenta TaxID=4460 RepID=A0A843XNF9_COLES|nr:hypothetical protein [Colocasia esculenta]